MKKKKLMCFLMAGTVTMALLTGFPERNCRSNGRSTDNRKRNRE